MIHFNNKYRWLLFFIVSLSLSLETTADSINRKTIVSAFSPQITNFDKSTPFTLGNGKFAFTADITGLQSFGEDYFSAGFPLETKARWAWHSKPNAGYSLADANEEYDAYERKVNFPTRTNNPAAQWLRQNPHDLPLGRIALLLDGKKIDVEKISSIKQHLDLWQGKLTSQYSLDGTAVSVESAVHATRDAVSFKMNSALAQSHRLSIEFRFPRSYDFSVKNTPNMNWADDEEHNTEVVKTTQHSALIKRKVDNQLFSILIAWKGEATLKKNSPHQFELLLANKKSSQFEFTVEYLSPETKPKTSLDFNAVASSAKTYWKNYWQSGAFVDFTQSSDPLAPELQRRVVLSQYLLAAQSRDKIPTQETGLTSSSWYGKFHTEVAWLHYSHWMLWSRTEYAEPILDWYLQHLDTAKKIASERGLQGARWPKMIANEGRESPGGNPLIIWNQPQAIQLAEMLFEKTKDKKVLEKYASVVEETAQAMSSMLTKDQSKNRYVLDSPIWISQEIYTPKQTRNPTYELAYWRYGLEVAQAWRTRRGLAINPQWQEQLNLLSELPIRNGKYVAIESIPDTFDNPESREDHPSMLAPTGFLNDARIDKKIMNTTLDAILATWRFDTKIWGWDYPMLAMTAARLNRSDLAVKLLLMDSKNNHYLINGNCPQAGAELPVYMPANASLLTAVAVMLEKDSQTGKYIGFPNNSAWVIRAEGF